MAKFSKYQQNVIRNYYENRDAIALQKLQEQVTELYLATGKKRDRYLKAIAGNLEKLGVKKEHIDHLIGQDDPQLIAHEVERLINKQ